MSHDYCYQLVTADFLGSARPDKIDELQSLAKKADVWVPASQIDSLESAWSEIAAELFAGRRLDQVRKLIPLVLRGDGVIDRRLQTEVSKDYLRVLAPPRLAQAMEFVKSLRPSKLDRRSESIQQATKSLRELAVRCDPVTHRWVVYVEQ